MSSYFRDVMALRLLETAPPVAANQGSASLFYTSYSLIREEHWQILRFEPVNESELRLTLRVVADHVWLGDERLREATEVDHETLPGMGVNGLDALIYELETHLGMDTSWF